MLLHGKTLQYFVFLTAILLTIQCGLHIAWSSPSLPQLLSNTSTIFVTNDEGSWIASAFLIGQACGAIVIILTLDVIGRKKAMVATYLVLFASWLMIAFAQTTVELYISRFLAGIADSTGFSCVLVYLPEVTDPKVRGFFISSTVASYIFGAYLVNLLGSFFTITTVALIAAMLSVAVTCFSFLIPESPHFFLLKKDVAKAKNALERFHGSDNVDDLLDSAERALLDLHNQNRSWLELFTDPNNRKSFCIVVLLRALQVFNGYIGITFYMQTLFEEVVRGKSPVMFISVFYVIQIACTVVNAVLVDKIGRRPFAIMSTCTVAIALAIISVCFTIKEIWQTDLEWYSWVLIAAFFVFIIGHSCGLNTISTILVGELFPLHVKIWAIGLLDVLYGLGGVVVSKFFQYTKDEYGIHVPFIAFTACIVCGLPLVIYYAPETKGKTLEEIQNQVKMKT